MGYIRKGGLCLLTNQNKNSQRRPKTKLLLSKIVWSLFVWILAMGKIQKGPGSMPKGLEFSYNGKSGMTPNYITTPLS